jgi:hypothetical protein
MKTMKIIFRSSVIKKCICVFLLSLFLLSCQYTNIKPDNNIPVVKSYKYYNALLSDDIYPKIEKIVSHAVSSSTIQEPDQKEIADKIFSIFTSYQDLGKISINKIRPPAINFSPDVKLADGSFVSYIILRIEFIDDPISDQYIHFGLVYINSFVLKRTHTKEKI